MTTFDEIDSKGGSFAMDVKTPNKSDNSIRIVIATTNEQLLDAYAVRSICFMEEKGVPARFIFDGNDFQSTHIVVYSDDEPIGSARIRWFNNFIKIERTAVRRAYRNPRILVRTATFMFEHAARKGYSKAITLAEPQYANVWVRLLGFKAVAERPPVGLGGGESYLELVKDFAEAKDRLTVESDPKILLRVEGYWDRPTAFEA
jgi:hypothetical protein